MPNTQLNAQDLLDDILKAGQDLIAQGKSQTAGLTEKGKALASKGEDILVEKLGVEDNEVSREALRKGVGAGAAAGALALLLSSRSGRKLATLGGLGALGAVAFKAYKDGKMPTTTDEVIGLLTGKAANDRAGTLLKAMIAAAQADGTLNGEEHALIASYDGASAGTLEDLLAETASAKDIAALSTSDQEAREIYAVSCRVANGLNDAERDYLDELAMALRLDPELAARIETDVRTG